MGMANYSNGFRGGVMIRGSALYDARYGRVWYVDAKIGGDGTPATVEIGPFSPCPRRSR
jgi:hypothetical protein